MAERRPDRRLEPKDREFWDWCQRGELRLQRCGHCGALVWPVVDACDHCARRDLTWERMSGRGRIASWCSFERDYYDGLLPIPWDTILVELDEGPLFLSNPAGFTCDDIELDMRVALTFADCEDAAGPYQLPVFGRA